MSPLNTRSQTYPSGIDGVSLGEITRQVPADEPPPLAPNAKLAVIGKAVPRINAHAKVTGAIRFTVDVKLPGMLHGRLLRSPHPHARIAAIDISAAKRHPGVHAVELISEPVDRAIEALDETGRDRDRRVLYVGDAIAAVAASTPEAAEAVLSLIAVDYQPLPFVVDLEDARKPAAPVVFRGPVHGESFAGGNPATGTLLQHGNVRGPNTAGSRGDVEQGFAARQQ
jgi:xanthine dehydrogenase YagR molybdenum-binding subunit